MGFFPNDIDARFRSPRHAGIAGRCRGVGASFACGSATTIGIEFDGDAVARARFGSTGCGWAVAAADVVCETLEGRRTAELGGRTRELLRAAIARELGEFPPERADCASVAVEAAARALDERRARATREFAGETALVCACFGVGEDEIEAAIAAGASDVDEIADACRAGLGCGSCRMLIAELLDAA